MSTLRQDACSWKEGRRLRAWQLKESGWRQQEIAQALGVGKGTVSKWMAAACRDGAGGRPRGTCLYVCGQVLWYARNPAPECRPSLVPYLVRRSLDRLGQLAFAAVLLAG